jgi:hypothetical protein
MIETIQGHGIKVVLVTLPPVVESLLPADYVGQRFDRRARQYGEAVAEIARADPALATLDAWTVIHDASQPVGELVPFVCGLRPKGVARLDR